MYIFLDESGDLGFDFENTKTNRYFVITLLVCDDKSAADQFKIAVRRTLKNKLNNKKNKSRIIQELKGIGTTLTIKKYFYSQLPQNGWQLYSITLDKYRASFHHRSKAGKKQLYNRLAHTLLEKVNFPEELSVVHLVVDRCKNRKEIEEFNKQLIGQLEGFLPLYARLVINHSLSHENPGLQAVDLFCWGIYRRENFLETDWFSQYQEKVAYDSRFSVLRRDE